MENQSPDIFIAPLYFLPSLPILVPFLVAVITWLTESNLWRVGLCWLAVQSNTVHHCGAPPIGDMPVLSWLSSLPFVSCITFRKVFIRSLWRSLSLTHTKVCLLNALGKAGEMAQFMLQGPEFEPEKLLQKSQALWHAPNASKGK